MLPEYTKACRVELQEKLQQTEVSDHFKPAPPKEKPQPYSDKIFKDAAIQWLIETDQVSRICIIIIVNTANSINSAHPGLWA